MDRLRIGYGSAQGAPDRSAVPLQWQAVLLFRVDADDKVDTTVPGMLTLILLRICRQSLPVVAALFLVGLAPLAFARDAGETYVYREVDRIVVFGDVHGAMPALVTLLRGTGLIDAEDHWVGGNTHLVSLGDLIDRGDATRPVLELMIRLEGEARDAGGRVHVLLGNHELMNLIGDWRDVTAGDLASFAQPGGADRVHVRKDAFSSSGAYGRWLLQRPLLIRINDRLFTHGGLPSLLLETSLDEANSVPQSQLSALVRNAEALVQGGIIEPDTKLYELQDHRPSEDTEDPRLNQLRRLINSAYFGDYGPLWYRGTTGCAAVIEHDLTHSVLEHFGVASVVVGHMPTWNHEVRQIMGGKVWAIDTGMLTAVYGGKASALRIEQGLVTVLNAEGQPVGSSVETFEPYTAEKLDRLSLEFEDQYALRLPAQQPGAEQSPAAQGDQLVEVFDKSDAVRSLGWFRRMNKRQVAKELAAWRLDRLLGLGLVPDTFAAELGSASGIVATKDAPVLTEQQRSTQGRSFPNWCERGNSYQAVVVFDALINKTTRNTSNLSYGHRLTSLRLTGHADSFGTASKPPKTSLPPAISETLRLRLAALTMESVTAALGELLSRREIRALLSRRDVIVRWPGIAAS